MNLEKIRHMSTIKIATNIDNAITKSLNNSTETIKTEMFRAGSLVEIIKDTLTNILVALGHSYKL